MPSVDELLNAAEITEETLTETNDKIEIDADTRTMIIPDTERIFGVMSDEKGERKYFRCKRFVGNGTSTQKIASVPVSIAPVKKIIIPCGIADGDGATYDAFRETCSSIS